MNAMQMMASQPWVERLGMTLLHFLWQGLLVAIVYAAARRRVTRTSGPQIRYLLACGALAAMMAAPVMTWELMRPADASPEAMYRIRSIPPAVSTAAPVPAATLPDSIRATVAAAPSELFLFWIVLVWLAGAIVFWVRLAGGWLIAARMRSMLVRRAPPEWQETLRKLGAQIGLARSVRLLVSALVQVPTVVGWLRPVVLVPVGALGGLPAEQLEMLLLHELAHIRRHDYLVNVLQSVAESLLFYHPAVWWVSGHIRAERELCCDDIAVSTSGNPLAYAHALAQLESCRQTQLSAAMAANGGSLANRIARLLGQPRPMVPSGLGPSLLAAAILLAAVAYGLLAQSTRPTFEVASIKRNVSNWSDPTHHPMGGGYQPGGRLRLVNLPLTGLIQFAYADHDSAHWLPLPPSQIVGGPAWAKTDGYDIEARPEHKTDPKHMWLMLQTLLADRFRLALHRETRELPVYDLEVAKRGLKLPAPKNVDCVSFPPGTPPRQVPGKVDCGHVAGFFGLARGLLRLKGSRIHMRDLVRELASILDRPVLDKVGFTGEFDLNLSFTSSETLTGIRDLGSGSSLLPTDSDRPSFFTALEEQLGLRLVPAKSPVEVLVIDHAERPSAN
ncbi:MAG TPA: M56 family metallopeptidase [Bryobacteraceae bacterium]|nr:M56 family metallopeptidase [Bryobacteraceae bacterium]